MNTQEFGTCQSAETDKQEMGGVNQSTQVSSIQIKHRVAAEQELSQVHQHFHYLLLDGALPVCMQIGHYP